MTDPMDICPFLQQALLLGLRAAFGMRVTGRGNVPRSGGVIIACNHISNLDPPVLGSAVPRRVSFMAKSELFTTRAGEFYLPRLGAFPVNRRGVDTAALRAGVAELESGRALIVFPEGTRSHDGRMLPLKAGIGLIAARSGVPVVPAFMWGTHDPAAAAMRRHRFAVAFGRPLCPGQLRGLGVRGMTEKIGESMAEVGRSMLRPTADEAENV
jgi:1-acyl-sn-glycerol-3-phosphate acyltransferase